jgi:hypothetical protein
MIWQNGLTTKHQAHTRCAVPSADTGKNKVLASDIKKPHPARKPLPAGDLE